MHYASIKHIDWKYLNILLNLWLQCHLPATIFQKIYFSPLSPPEQSLCTKNWGHLSTIIWYIWFSCVALWHCFMKIVSNQIYYLWSWFFELHTWFPHSPEPSWKVSIYQMVSLCMAFNLINKIFLYLLMAFSLSMSWIFGLQTAVPPPLAVHVVCAWPLLQTWLEWVGTIQTHGFSRILLQSFGTNQFQPLFDRLAFQNWSTR